MESVKILQYRRWYAYEKDVHEKMLTSLSMVPAEGRREERFQKAVDLAAHLVAARWLWLRRLGASSESRDLFPSGVALGDLRAEFEEVESAWDDYLERLDDEELEREFEYGALEGGAVPESCRRYPYSALRPFLVPPWTDRCDRTGAGRRARRHRLRLLVPSWGQSLTT
jgi:uncharacterized damage-inducible protein DinB